jgi:FkbM family methyltransferase
MKQLNFSPDHIADENWRDDNRNILTQQLAQAVCSRNDTIIDIGVNCMQNTKKFLELVGTDGCVVGFEPIVEHYNRAKQWAHDKNLNLQMHQIALSNYIGVANFYHYDEPDGISSLFYTRDHPHRIYQIDVTTLDTYIEQFNRVVFIKLDIEDSELMALQGGINVLKKFQPVIVTEQFNDDVIEWFDTIGYVYLKSNLKDFHVFVPKLNITLINQVRSVVSTYQSTKYVF